MSQIKTVYVFNVLMVDFQVRFTPIKKMRILG